ncbi:MAG: HAMP domain-containing protein [Rhodocyclaceae bacterium]|nr:HAMP domain-containing protein [Rhodocyclaceae bacterium]
MNLNLSIRSRITLLVAIAFLTSLAIGGYAVFKSNVNANKVQLVTDGVFKSALASADLVSKLRTVQIATMDMVSAPDKQMAEQAKAIIDTQRSEIFGDLAFQEQSATSETQKGLVRQAVESFNNYFDAISQTAQFKLAGDTDTAQALLFASVAQYQREMSSIVDTLRVEKNRSKDEAVQDMNEGMISAVTTISILTVLALAGLSILGWLLYRRVVQPIGRMQSMMTQIAESHDYSQRLPVEADDEIGRSTAAFNTMVNEIDKSSAMLQQKTNDMLALLQNMPQGVLAIEGDGRIHPEYSAYLETILQSGDISGRPFMEVVFSHASLSRDTLSQVEAAVGACLGEDEINFEFNSHLLTSEFEKQMADGSNKILDLNWSPITDAAGNIVRLLLCIRDVTELRKLAAEATAQKRELEMIGEILAVDAGKFHDFVVSTIKLIDEIDVLLHESLAPSQDVLAQLFRNMHTVKGNARTYGLRHLADLAHEAERSYEELRKPHPTLAWDHNALIDELNIVRAGVEHYARINEVSLGRKTGGASEHVGENYLLVDPVRIQEAIHYLERINTSNISELVAATEQVHKVLRLLGTERITQTLGEVFSSLPSLAAELGKVPPIVEIEDNGCFIKAEAGATLKNVCMHLARNAMDHGIESPDERSLAGKPLAGRIALTLEMSNERFIMALADDGRGLALNRIREAAVARGLLKADQPADDEFVAQLIFHSGFSTASKLTDISGRGVGMDAVKSFIERMGGTLAIVFSDAHEGAEFRQFKTVIELPGEYAVQVEGEELERIAFHAGHHEGEAESVPNQSFAPAAVREGAR